MEQNIITSLRGTICVTMMSLFNYREEQAKKSDPTETSSDQVISQHANQSNNNTAFKLKDLTGVFEHY